ncbi:glycosyltransferase family 4 protein [Methanothermococcus okinawensis]|uniref:Glycosyl transferase group 1 n=1 Tax=Methanothermococcus okinawensis (strain DSM 14208 / JCM 11175 / IH1) TaxID=647113 RepID=F8AN29_METOI|nr:glycosyltransferase family 4 protein [Methanothermococcus okinawensis]AEH06943.1 glycosyl transferase group 1 [Methanothermococcus okinawensis IH1]
MKILMPTIFHPYIGGITFHVENIIKELNKLNKLNNSDYEFHILNYKSKINSNNSNNRDNNSYNFNSSNICIHNVPYIPKIRGISYVYNGYNIGKELLHNKDIDIIHSHYAFPQGFLGAILKNKYNIPHILTLHGSDILRLSKNPLGKLFFNYVVKNCDKIICVSEFLKYQLPKAYQNKTEVIYNGVDFDLFYDINRDENYGLFVGSFVPQKGIDILIDAVKDIDFNFKLIGDGILFNIIKTKIDRENISNIELLGKKNQKEVAEYIKKCSFLVLPSISEGLGMVLLEAMASGKAVIGTNVGGIPELVKDNFNGFLIEPKNPNVLREKINILINDKDLRREMGKNGKRFSKGFSWKESAKRVNEIYNNLVIE